MFKAFNDENISDLFVVDIGYSATNTSCGLLWTGSQEAIETTFADAISHAAEQLPKLSAPILVIEAPLSTYHDKNGNPSIRGDFERGRGWYYSAGATTCLAAMRFLDQLAKMLEKKKCQIEIFIAEAFLSNKDTNTGHGADAQTIFKKFATEKNVELSNGVEPASPHVKGTPPVRKF